MLLNPQQTPELGFQSQVDLKPLLNYPTPTFQKIGFRVWGVVFRVDLPTKFFNEGIYLDSYRCSSDILQILKVYSLTKGFWKVRLHHD